MEKEGEGTYKELLKAIKHDIDKRFDNIERKFNDIDKRFDNIERKFNDIDKRFDGIESRVEETINNIPSDFSDPQTYESDFNKKFKIYIATPEEKYEEISPTAKKVLKLVVEKKEKKWSADELAEFFNKKERRARYSSILHMLYLSGFLEKETKGKRKEYFPTQEAINLFTSKELLYEK